MIMPVVNRYCTTKQELSGHTDVFTFPPNSVLPCVVLCRHPLVTAGYRNCEGLTEVLLTITTPN